MSETAALSSSFPLQEGPLIRYRQKIAAREINPDPEQERLVSRLDLLWEQITFAEKLPEKSGVFGFFKSKKEPVSPRGLYIAGPVGRGKSLLTDLFFSSVSGRGKRRVHFHQFIQEQHRRIFTWKKENPQGKDPITPLADQIAKESPVLCFDEFQINDIADAMILGRLFEALFVRRVIIVATSNTVPDNLFKGQPGREAFLPFIELIKQNLDVIEIDGGKDYRRLHRPDIENWSVTATKEEGRQILAKIFTEFFAPENHEPFAETLNVNGREIHFPQASHKALLISFHDLCGVPLGAADYLEIAARFKTVLLQNVPVFTDDNFDESRRFVTLIDTFYEAKTHLYATSAVSSEKLMQGHRGAEEFKRTASRLAEMQTKIWLEKS